MFYTMHVYVSDEKNLFEIKDLENKTIFTSYCGQSFNSTYQITKEDMTFYISKRTMQEDTKSTEDHEPQNVEFEIKK